LYLSTVRMNESNQLNSVIGKNIDDLKGRLRENAQDRVVCKDGILEEFSKKVKSYD